jgi:mannose-1-phosphate guanylyltransferase / mannose-6-phosphate isomerase
MPSRIVPVIMCGGAGTRLWPISRESMPKQFVPLVGDRSTFAQVLERVADSQVFCPPIVITSSEFRFVVAEQAQRSGSKVEILLEPMPRDSGPAVAVATEFIARRDPSANVLVLAADHLVRRPRAFVETCRVAAPIAASGRIVTFGVQPTAPATSYGYIRPGPTLNGLGASEVAAFAEKPDAETAARYVAEGYLWNSGNFMFRAEIMRNEIARLEPPMASAARDAVENASIDLDFIRLPEDALARSPKISIDYAIMERTHLAAVVPLDCDWSDVGTWNAVWDVQDRDSNGNVVIGTAELIDTRDSLVHSEAGLLTAVIDCEGLVVISTSDAVLVVPRDRAERVKSLVEGLKAKNHIEAVAHRRIYRPWGYYQGIDVGNRYQVKRIVVNPGGRLSLQKHYHRAEHWVVVRGIAEATVGTQVSTVHENESIYVPIGQIHRLSNPGKIPLELIEVQVGSYLGEDDIVRLEDVYSRM